MEADSITWNAIQGREKRVFCMQEEDKKWYYAHQLRGVYAFIKLKTSEQKRTALRNWPPGLHLTLFFFFFSLTIKLLYKNCKRIRERSSFADRMQKDTHINSNVKSKKTFKIRGVGSRSVLCMKWPLAFIKSHVGFKWKHVHCGVIAYVVCLCNDWRTFDTCAKSP